MTYRTHRDEFLSTHPDFHPGMLAFSDDGRELGEVQKLDEENLTIEKGGFFSVDRRLPYDAVSDIRGDHLIINRGQVDLDEWKTPDYTGLQESGLADVEEAGAAVPIYQKDLEDLERAEQDAATRTSPEEGPPDADRMTTEHTPADRGTGPMSGGESFRDEQAQARKEVEVPTESYEDSGKIPNEAVKFDRDRIEKKK